MQCSAIPVQIANSLRGEEYRIFKEFRNAFWRLIAKDPVLGREIDLYEQILLERGVVPFAAKSEAVGARRKYEIHHKQRVADGGAVYDVDNMVILSPKFHVQIHRVVE